MSVEDRLVDEELAELPRDVVEGAFRSICAAMLLRTMTLFSTANSTTKERIYHKAAASDWLFRGGGVITYQEACGACSISTQHFKDAVVEYADNPSSRPNNRYRVTPNRQVFGRAIYARTKSQAAGNHPARLVPGNRDGNGAGRHAARRPSRGGDVADSPLRRSEDRDEAG